MSGRPAKAALAEAEAALMRAWRELADERAPYYAEARLTAGAIADQVAALRAHLDTVADQ